MTNLDSSYFNMVERKENELASLLSNLLKLTKERISVDGLEFDLKQLEKEEKFLLFDDKEKILQVIKESDNPIKKWYDELELEMDTSKLSYKKFKELLLERFGEEKMTLSDYFNQHQFSEEPIDEYIRRMEVVGRKLKQTSEVRLQALKQGLRRYRDRMREILLGEDKITPKVIQKLREGELLRIEKEKRRNKFNEGRSLKGARANNIVVRKRTVICFRCGAEGHIAPECHKVAKKKQVNQVEEDAISLLNKSDLLYANSKYLKPLIDTGSGENYITIPAVLKLNLRI